MPPITEYVPDGGYHRMNNAAVQQSNRHLRLVDDSYQPPSVTTPLTVALTLATTTLKVTTLPVRMLMRL